MKANQNSIARGNLENTFQSKSKKQASSGEILQAYKTSSFQPIQFVTTIDHTTDNFSFTDDEGDTTTQEVGVSMSAHLDPTDEREGTSPGGELDNLMGALGTQYPQHRMIRGHLLNGNLGGLGVMENLFPITNRANRLHETQVENHIKNEIQQGNSIDYNVNVTDAAMEEDDADATFHCEAWQADGTKIIDKNIDSFPSANRRNSAGNEDLNANNQGNLPRGRSYQNANLPVGWGERGSGRRGELVRNNNNELYDNTNNRVHATYS
jgi:hypothetical protein